MIFLKISEIFPNPLLLFAGFFGEKGGFLFDMGDVHWVFDHVFPFFVEFGVKVIFDVSERVLVLFVYFLDNVIEVVVAELFKEMWYLIESLVLASQLAASASYNWKCNFWVFCDVLTQFGEVRLVYVYAVWDIWEFIAKIIKQLKSFDDIWSWVFVILIQFIEFFHN